MSTRAKIVYLNSGIMIAQKDDCGIHYHASAEVTTKFNHSCGEEIELSTRRGNSMKWCMSGDGRPMDLSYCTKASAKGRYSVGSKFDFGIYNGFELGIVFSVDSDYISWCIENLDFFRVSELTRLYEFGIFEKPYPYERSRHCELPIREKFLSHFSTLKNLRAQFPFLNTTFRFSDNIERTNKEKLESYGCI